MYNIVFREESLLELQDAYDWYESKQLGLGDDFISTLNHYIKLIETNPKSYQVFYKNKRVVFLKKFPYQVIYSIHQKDVVILSVFHSKRNPKIWKRKA